MTPYVALYYGELLDAGAPELPAGMFYRVRLKDDTLRGRWLHLEIRERGRWFSRSLTGVKEINLEDRTYGEGGTIALYDPGEPDVFVSMLEFVALHLFMLHEELGAGRHGWLKKSKALDALLLIEGDFP